MSALFRLVRLLEQRQIYFMLERTRPDTIRVNAVLVGERLEIDVFEDDHLEFSRFLDHEDIEGDWPELNRVLDDHR